MEENQFYAFIDKLERYAKLQRLYYEHDEGYVRLGQMPQDFEELCRKAIRHLESEFERLSDSKWKECLTEYNKAFIAFKEDYLETSIKYAKKAQEDNEDAKSYYKTNFLERLKTVNDSYKRTFYSTEGGYLISPEYKLFIQNQSSVKSFNTIQKSLKKWNEITSIKEKVELLSKVKKTLVKKVPSIEIDKSSQLGIYTALVKYISNDDHKLYLSRLLAGEKIPPPIVIEHQQGSIAYLFRQALEAGKISNEKTKIRDWLVYWFNVLDGRTQKPLNLDTVYDALSKDKKPAKANRIPYTP